MSLQWNSHTDYIKHSCQYLPLPSYTHISINTTTLARDLQNLNGCRYQYEVTISKLMWDLPTIVPTVNCRRRESLCPLKLRCCWAMSAALDHFRWRWLPVAVCADLCAPWAGWTSGLDAQRSVGKWPVQKGNPLLSSVNSEVREGGGRFGMPS